MENGELKNRIEALLFSCGRKMELREMTRFIRGIPEQAIKDIVKGLAKEYDDRESPTMIVEEGTDEEFGWKINVREKYLKTVRKITPYMEFPKTIMETLAVIAWKQPVLQSDVINIRTNKAYEHISELEKMGFLAKERHGRSYLLKLSQKFYDYFDLRDDVDVRKLFKSIKDDDPESQKKVGEFEEKVEEKADKAEEDEGNVGVQEPAPEEPGIINEEPEKEDKEDNEVDVEVKAPVDDDAGEDVKVEDEITGSEDDGATKELDIEEENSEDKQDK